MRKLKSLSYLVISVFTIFVSVLLTKILKIAVLQYYHATQQKEKYTFVMRIVDSIKLSAAPGANIELIATVIFVGAAIIFVFIIES